MQFSLRKNKHIKTIIFTSAVIFSLLIISLILSKYTCLTNEATATNEFITTFDDGPDNENFYVSNIYNGISNRHAAPLQGIPDQIFTVADTPTETGKISAKIRDSVTRDENIPQGDATFSGISLVIGNMNNFNVTYNGSTIGPAELFPTAFVTDSNGAITTDPLPIGYYRVCESEWNYSYMIPTGEDDACREVEVTSNNQAEVTFYNDVYTSTYTIRQYDIEVFKTVYAGEDSDASSLVGECVALGAGNFNGVIFNFYNGSNNPIYYNGQKIEIDGLIGTGTVSENNCIFTFDNIPYGSYYVRRFGSATGYSFGNGASPLYSNHEKNYGSEIQSTFTTNIFATSRIDRGGVSFTKINKNTNRPIANVPFEIRSNTTGEKHIVMSNGISNSKSSVKSATSQHLLLPSIIYFESMGV